MSRLASCLQVGLTDDQEVKWRRRLNCLPVSEESGESRGLIPLSEIFAVQRSILQQSK
jgi:hypothetical protein